MKSNKEYGKKINSIWVLYLLRFDVDGNQKKGNLYFFADGSGSNHHPGHEQLIKDGYRLVVPTIFVTETHKLLDGSYSVVDATTMRQDTIALTVDEIATAATNLKSSLVAYTKAMANRLIVAKITEWKQRNLTALAVKNNHKMTVALFVDRFLLPTETDPEKIAEYEEVIATAITDFQEDYATNEMIEATYDGQVTPIRSASDDIEVEIEAGLITTTEQIDNNIAWGGDES